MTTTPRTPQPSAGEYEPPRIEQILTPEDLERQAHFAGEPSGTS